jgi:tRNA nucleotidyltransferase (CCA-adding enzyme)
LEIYLVGGAVRDRLLGRPVQERDYLVVGGTPEQMRDLGFLQVGRDFPIFLHPQSRAEYALARTERHSTGRQAAPLVHAAPDVTLQDDLRRRDLTINALAENAQGQVIDYFGGQRDLELRLLRHVSPAFAEDPLRILRVARFMARYGALGFRVAEETQALMSSMVAAGALDTVVPERVWQELVKALGEVRPPLFFETLRACGALSRILPELERLWGVPQPPRWHPEIDTGLHAMLVLQMARSLSDDPTVIFAALTHDLGKGETPPEIWPSHRGHEERSVRLVEQVCRRLRAPTRYRELARLVARYHGHIHRAPELRPGTVLCILQAVDAFRRPQRLEDLLLACEADYRGRTGFAERPYPQRSQFRRWAHAATAVDSATLVAANARPELIGQAVARARLRAIKGASPHPDSTSSMPRQETAP